MLLKPSTNFPFGCCTRCVFCRYFTLMNFPSHTHTHTLAALQPNMASYYCYYYLRCSVYVHIIMKYCTVCMEFISLPFVRIPRAHLFLHRYHKNQIGIIRIEFFCEMNFDGRCCVSDLLRKMLILFIFHGFLVLARRKISLEPWQHAVSILEFK